MSAKASLTLMAPISTEDFPYTVEYVMQLLSLDEHTLMTYAQKLTISPKQDPQTGKQFFTHKEVDLLKKAMEMAKHGEDPGTLQRYSQPVRQSPENLPAAPGASLPSSRGPRLPGEKQENLALIVEAVSQAKEGILKDLARLLDDKLAGLDEVVVELIRCKSENDSLKQKLKASQSENEHLTQELARFKPVQFGFYKKV